MAEPVTRTATQVHDDAAAVVALISAAPSKARASVRLRALGGRPQGPSDIRSLRMGTRMQVTPHHFTFIKYQRTKTERHALPSAPGAARAVSPCGCSRLLHRLRWLWEGQAPTKTIKEGGPEGLRNRTVHHGRIPELCDPSLQAADAPLHAADLRAASKAPVPEPLELHPASRRCGGVYEMHKGIAYRVACGVVHWQVHQAVGATEALAVQ